jgi:hypothetical protein
VKTELETVKIKITKNKLLRKERGVKISDGKRGTR